MIRFVRARGDGTLLFMGIDRRNIERLLAGDPIMFDPASLGLRLVPAEIAESGPDRVAIAADETLASLAKKVGFPFPGEPQPGQETRIVREVPDSTEQLRALVLSARTHLVNALPSTGDDGRAFYRRAPGSEAFASLVDLEAALALIDKSRGES